MMDGEMSELHENLCEHKQFKSSPTNLSKAEEEDSEKKSERLVLRLLPLGRS